MRKTPLVTDEIYHIYNRGTDKRIVIIDQEDLDRFYQSMIEFNTTNAIGSIYEKSKRDSGHPMSKNQSEIGLPLVEFISYCLNSNHYHFILKQKVDRGVERFMQKIGNGYTKYFNNKYKRSGVLFQGKFKSILVDSNEYLLHLSAYVNLNNQLPSANRTNLFSKSSWDEFLHPEKVGLCKTDIILGQYNSPDEYQEFAQSSFIDIENRKNKLKELENELF